MTFKRLFMIAAAVSVCAVTAARASLVTNGGFETGTLSGWTAAGNGISIDSTFAADQTYDAAFGASLADPSPGILSQPIATVPGTGYVLSFTLLDESGANTNTFTVGFGGFSVTITGDMAPGFTPESFQIPGSAITAISTTLQFQGANGSSDWNLDDVSVTAAAIPEPHAGFAVMAFVLGLVPLSHWRRVRRARGDGGLPARFQPHGC